MTDAFNFPPGPAPEVWEIVDTKTGKKLPGHVLYVDYKFMAWLHEGGSFVHERAFSARTLEELSVKLDAYFNGVDDDRPARLKGKRAQCWQLRRGDWVQLPPKGWLSGGWDRGFREVVEVHSLDRVTVRIRCTGRYWGDPGVQEASDTVERHIADTCYVLYVDPDFSEWKVQPA